jgi:CSLREA domain-containing protein
MRASVLLAVLALLLVAPGVARAQVPQVIVNTTDDHDDGACTAQDCTLREAVRFAQPDTTIRLGAATYRLTSALTSNAEEVNILGRGPRATTIDGNGQTRLLNVSAGTVTVSGVRFARGNAQSGDGGAIAVQAGAVLGLVSSAVENSRANDGAGGGIASEGRLALVSSLIAYNQASGNGGGIAMSGTGPLVAHNSTISGNTAGDNGGGIYAGAPTTITFTTIAANQAASGGGVYRPEGGIPGTAHNSLLAGNRLTGGQPSACGGAPEPPLTTSYNVVADGQCPVPPDQHVQDARLEPLRSNGGPTSTHAPRPDSPAIGAADPECEDGTDQRGVPRPQGGRCDVGAVEAAHAPFEPVGRVAGRPIDVFADGLGRLQVRFNDDPGGAFEPRAGEVGTAGFVIVEDDEIYYPLAGDNHGYQIEIGQRTTISGPHMIVRGNARELLSEYYAGPALRITERVFYEDGERGFRVSYRVENVSTRTVPIRAGQLAALGVSGTGSRTANSIGVTAANGARVSLEAITAWEAAQVGADDSNGDVFEAFAAGGLEDNTPSGTNDEIGAEWSRTTLQPGTGATFEIAWRVAEATQEVTVNTTADTVVEDCEAPPGDCTLREALELAPAGAVIRVPAGEYNLVTGPLLVPVDRVIRGAGARRTIIRAAPGARVLQVSGTSLGLSGVTITGGAPNTQDGAGGGILASGALAVADSAVTGNTAGAGGGIAVSGALSLVRSTISGNTTTGESGEFQGAGGGILAFLAQLWVVNSTISGNTATGAQAVGGGFIKV